MRTVLVTLIGPERTTDLVVDGETPVGALMPSLLANAGVGAEADPREWGVAAMGREPLPAERTLIESEVLDGAVLVLRRVERPDEPRTGGIRAPTSPAGSPLERFRRRLADAGPPETAIARPMSRRCATIAIVAPKGGVGKTTAAIALGEAYASARAEVVLALDADGDYGSLGRIGPNGIAASRETDPPPPLGELDDSLFTELSQGAVTFAELDRRSWKLPLGLRTVPSPRDPLLMARTDRAAYARVIGNLQRLAGVLLLDCGTGLAQAGTQAAVLACDQLIVVCDASPTTIDLTAEAVALLQRAGRPVTVLCNRLPRGRAGAETLARADARFPHAAALCALPEDPAAELALRGELDLARAPRTFTSAVEELAAVLALDWTQADRQGVGSSAPARP